MTDLELQFVTFNELHYITLRLFRETSLQDC